MSGIVEQVYQFLNIKDSYQLPERMMEALLGDKREQFFRALKYTASDLDNDLFYQYFQDEHAERKKLKQDFTPPQVTELISELVLTDNNYIYEPTAGTGGILVKHWSNNKTKKDNVFYVAEEISSRAVPMLLFNLALRGMNGVVIQCDSISRDAEAVFLIDGYDEKYSKIKVMPYTKDVEREFNIKFTSKPYKRYTEWHTQVKEVWDNLTLDKTEITEISLEKLGNYDIITITDGKELLGIVDDPKDIKGEILKIHEVKAKGKIARVTVRRCKD